MYDPSHIFSGGEDPQLPMIYVRGSLRPSTWVMRSGPFVCSCERRNAGRDVTVVNEFPWNCLSEGQLVERDRKNWDELCEWVGWLCGTSWIRTHHNWTVGLYLRHGVIYRWRKEAKVWAGLTKRDKDGSWWAGKWFTGRPQMSKGKPKLTPS